LRKFEKNVSTSLSNFSKSAFQCPAKCATSDATSWTSSSSGSVPLPAPVPAAAAAAAAAAPWDLTKSISFEYDVRSSHEDDERGSKGGANKNRMSKREHRAEKKQKK
jgi:hypothetical protein